MSKKLLVVLMSFGLVFSNVVADVKDAPREEYVGSSIETITDAFKDLTIEEANKKKLELEKDDHDSKVTIVIKTSMVDSGRDEVIGISKTFSNKEELDKFIKNLEDQGYELNVNIEKNMSATLHTIDSKFDTESEAIKAKEDFEKTYTNAKVTISKMRNANKDDRSFNEGTTRYLTLNEAESVAKNLTVDNEEKTVSASVRTVTGEKVVLKENVNKTFDTEREADNYISELIKNGYNTSKITKKMLTKEEFTWDDGVEVDPGNPSGTFNYHHFDITVINNYTYVDKDGKESKVTGDLTISSVKIDGTTIKMGNKSKDPNRGDIEYASSNRKNLNVSNKSLVEITGTVIYNGKSLPFTVKGYLSEKQNVCGGRGNSKGFDLEFNKIIIYQDKVLVDTKLITKYQVTGEITKEQEILAYYVDVETIIKGYDYVVKGEGTLIKEDGSYFVSGNAKKDILEPRASIDIITETKLYERYGKVVTKYVDTKGNTLKEDVITIDKVGSKYETSYPESIGKYDFVYVDENSDPTSGEYEFAVKTITYVYEFVGGEGGDDPDFPRTGVTANYYLEIIFVISLLSLITVIKLKNN